MTEFEKALQKFEDEAYRHSLYPEVSDGAKAVAVSALREQLERSKGCEYCLDDCCPRWIGNIGSIIFFMVTNSALCAGGSLFQNRRYCPRCGMKI